MTTKRYTDEQLKEAVASSYSVMEVMRQLGIKMAGGSHHHISNRIKREGLDTSHFKGQTHNKGRPARNKLSPEQVFIILPEGSNRPKGYVLKRTLIEVGVEYKCAKCGLVDWLEKPLPLEVDHIDGNWLNNLRENLRFLCPNCHSQTPTHSRQRASVVE